jgi:hypothetical protein
MAEGSFHLLSFNRIKHSLEFFPRLSSEPKILLSRMVMSGLPRIAGSLLEIYFSITKLVSLPDELFLLEGPSSE